GTDQPTSSPWRVISQGPVSGTTSTLIVRVVPSITVAQLPKNSAAQIPQRILSASIYLAPTNPPFLDMACPQRYSAAENFARPGGGCLCVRSVTAAQFCGRSLCCK